MHLLWCLVELFPKSCSRQKMGEEKKKPAPQKWFGVGGTGKVWRCQPPLGSGQCPTCCVLSASLLSTPGSPTQRCREFLLRCFKKDPTQRPSARALIKDPWLAPFYSHRKGAHTHMCEGGGNGAYTHVRTCADTQPRTQPYAHTATPNTFQNAKKHQHTLHTLALNRICIMFGT